MAELILHAPPRYDQDGTLKENYDEFFAWSQELSQPWSQIPEIAEHLGFSIRPQPLGFLAIYLSPHRHDLLVPNVTGIVRADMFPPNTPRTGDIHNHGFDFYSGITKGVLVHRMHGDVVEGLNMGLYSPEGEGYIGYQNTVDFSGNNHSVLQTTARVIIPKTEVYELNEGDSYTMKPNTEFHSVDAEGETITIFAKTPTPEGSAGKTYFFLPPGHIEQPTTY